MKSAAKKTKKSISESGYMSIDDVGEFLSVSRSTVYLLLNTGAIPSAKFGRNRRIPRQAVIDFTEQKMNGKT